MIYLHGLCLWIRICFQDLASRMANGEYVKPCNDAETQCSALLSDLNYASNKTEGSISSKKNMQ
ncbi:hypothetical protein BT96DRAFT_1084039 [Gymnopus androsaceus JB14]|uniref:Uncharacterized protein n=1 Tax=Gymnopus androsaceus JB14 TaxID=1447944 RepID=A0A6A4GMQ0_9AGAR|nr:hypothetical protein BT96DRAFT_1084039 [Gymnopus androsaceus JB14]